MRQTLFLKTKNNLLKLSIGVKAYRIWEKIRLRRKAKKVVSKLLYDLKNNKVKRIRICFDTKFAPPTYGDFFHTVMLARFLEMSGYEIDFFIVSHSKREDWEFLSASQAENLILDFKKIASNYLNLKKSTVKIYESKVNTNANTAELKTEKIHLIAQQIIRILVLKNNWEVPSNFLLDENPKLNVSSNINQKFITWHIRLGKWDLKRNFRPSTILKDLLTLSKYFPNEKIMILSTKDGIHLFNSLTFENTSINVASKSKEKIITQPVNGFLSATEFLLNSQFYFQRSGGGMSAVALYTTIPYVMVNEYTYFWNLRGRFLHLSNFRIMPWSTKRQFLIYCPKKIDDFDIEKYLQKATGYDS